jgi:Protein of unknown function
MFPIHSLLTVGGKMSPELVDQTILASCKPQFLKVVRIIGDVDRALKGTNVDFIADRIKALVKAGRLEAAGNLNRWEASEIRLTGK